MDDLMRRYARQILGGQPAGNVCGIPVFINPAVPDDTIRFVEPQTGQYTDFKLAAEVKPNA